MKKVINIFDWVLEYIFIPIIVFFIWISALFIGIFCFIGPFLEGEHWWSLFYMCPLGLICLFVALSPLLFIINPNIWIDTINRNQKIP